jgi:Spy/CpxP family protein refolding chaperone
MQRFRAITACAIAIAVAYLAPDPLFAQQEAQKEKQQGADQAPGGEATSPRRRSGANETAVWWNSPAVIKQLSLDDEQRKKMDGYLEAFRRAEHEESRRSSFSEALADGNWREARTQLKQLENQAVVSIRTRGELKIDVLSALRENQRKTLVERYRRLIDQRWTTAMRVPGGAGREAGRAEPPSK